jgi:ATP-binding cassette subfamily C protein
MRTPWGGPRGADTARRPPRLGAGGPPTAGKIRLDATELRNWDRRQFGRYIGYLPQEVELFPGTVRENVCRMRDDLPDDKIYEAAQVAGVHEMIARLADGYETVIEGSGAPLSGGQKQRVALARALFGDPALIVLDEPNSNLDAEGEQALSETLQRAKRRGVTVVVVTQRPVLLGSVDRVLILRSGRAEALGPPAQVLRRAVAQPVPQQASPSPSGTSGSGGVNAAAEGPAQTSA